MKTKIVYCLVSDISDYYYEQLLISLHSLRKYNPDVQVEVVVDEKTNKTLVNARERIKSYVISIISVKVPSSFSKKQSSRYLKTSLRNIISGDFLFIDTDTIICASLKDIDNISSEICAIREYNGNGFFSRTDYSMRSFAEKVGLVEELDNEPYFNSGVMFVKDSPKAYELYDCWHSSWKETLSYGLSTDQTALCWANKKVGHLIEFMDDTWNCLIKLEGIRIVDQAKIVHYACEHKNTPHVLSLENMFAALKNDIDIYPYVNEIINQSDVFLIKADKELFLRESESFHFLYKKHYRIYKFLNWQANHIMGLLHRLNLL